MGALIGVGTSDETHNEQNIGANEQLTCFTLSIQRESRHRRLHESIYRFPFSFFLRRQAR